MVGAALAIIEEEKLAARAAGLTAGLAGALGGVGEGKAAAGVVSSGALPNSARSAAMAAAPVLLAMSLL
jgi:hypothetical protein